MAPTTQGVCFTPAELARRAAELLWRPPRGTSRAARQDDPRLARGADRVLDPACGDGALLVAAWRAATSGARAVEPERAARGLFGIELDPALAERARSRLRATLGGAAGRIAADNVRCADALDPATAWPAATHVLANPPWASLSGRQAAALDPERRALYAACWRAGASWPSLHGAFLERIARHVHAERTRAALLLPASTVELERYGALRRLVSSLTRPLAAPERLAHDAFPGVDEPAVLLGLCGAPERRGDAAAWWHGPGPDERAFLERMERFDPLPPACFADIGVHTGNARALLLAAAPSATTPGIREGRDLAAFRLGPARLGLRADLVPTPEQRFRFAALERYRAVPVLLRQTADRPIAALHREPTYFRNSLLACTPPEGLDPAAAVAVLNSEAVARWHRLRFPEALQRSFPQVKVGQLRRLPFPPLDAARSRALAMLAREAEEPDRAPPRAAIERLVAAAYGLPAVSPGRNARH